MNDNFKQKFHFPEEVKALISTLKDEKQWRILELLIESNNKISYTQLRKQMGMSENEKGTFNYHLNELEKAGWLRNWAERGGDVSDRRNSFYSISQFGMKTIEGIMQSLKESAYVTATTPKELITSTNSVQRSKEQSPVLVSNRFYQTLATQNMTVTSLEDERELIKEILAPRDDLGEKIWMSPDVNNVVVGVVDIVNSTKIAASLGINKIPRYYQNFLNMMSKILVEFDGHVIKNVGDSLLFYFPESSPPSSSIIKSIECALAMQEAHDLLCSQMEMEGLPPIDYRISLDYGKVIPMKSSDSKSLDMIGPAVNMCAKINILAKPNTVVIGGDLYQYVKRKDFTFEKIKGYSVGFKFVYPVYVVKSRST